jgi:hypothetical protein
MRMAYRRHFLRDRLANSRAAADVRRARGRSPRGGDHAAGALDGSASAGASGIGRISLYSAPVEEGAERARQHGYDRDRIGL